MSEGSEQPPRDMRSSTALRQDRNHLSTTSNAQLSIPSSVLFQQAVTIPYHSRWPSSLPDLHLEHQLICLAESTWSTWCSS